MSAPQRSWIARRGRVVGCLLYSLGFILFIVETQVPSTIFKIIFCAVFAGGMLLAVCGEFAEDMADEDERHLEQERKFPWRYPIRST